MGRRKNTNTIEFDTYTIRQPHYSRGDVQLKVPKGTVFTMYNGSTWINDVERNLYTFTAVFPYSVDMMDLLYKNNNRLNHNVENIIDKYIVWIINDIEPVDMDFPFTLEEYRLSKPIYARITKVDNNMLDKFISDARNSAGYCDDIAWKECLDQSTLVMSVLKINSIGNPIGVDATVITIRNSFNLQPYHMIKRDSYEYRLIFYGSGLDKEKIEQSSSEEFNNILNNTLQDLDVMF